MQTKLATCLLAAALSVTTMSAQFRTLHNGSGSATTTDPATLIANKVAYLKTLLTLTDAQAASATTIFTTELAAETTARTALATARTSLTAAVKSNSTATIASLSTQIGTLEGQLTLADATADAAFYALLTADQKTKFDALGDHVGGGDRGGRGH